jgi:hypothetical protein
MCDCKNHIGCAECKNTCNQVGYTPGSDRPVTPVPRTLLGLVPKPTDTVVTVKPTTPDVERDTIPLIVDKAKRTAWQVKKLAKELKGNSIEKTLANNSKFILDHIAYVKDDPAHEQIRSPRRTIHDGKGDCDCFSVLLAALLINQGIKFKFRIASYANKPGSWTHIYIVVPKNQKTLATGAGQYFTLDPVTNRHNYEVNFLRKKDYDMALQSLDGFGECTPEYSSLKPSEMLPVKTLLNRGYVITSEFLTAKRIPFTADTQGNVFLKTRNGIQKLPSMLSPDQVKQLRQQSLPVNGLAAAPPPSPGGSSSWLWISALAIGAIAVFGSGSPSLQGQEKIKKHVPVIHL